MKIPILRIPFYEEDRKFIEAGVETILTSGELTMGRCTGEFEEQFSDFVGSRFAIACSNGTAALELILRGLGIEGREIIIPTNTFMATALAVMHSGNRVVFADSEPPTLCLDIDDVERRVTDRTAGVILVHVGGIMTPAVERLRKLCDEKRLYLIEDCAHAHGSAIDGKHAGTLGVAGAFSFFPTKVMTTGEGGMVTTNRENLARQLRILRNHGKDPELDGRISEFGNNHRMSEVTALFGIQQVKQARRVITERRNIAKFYDSCLDTIVGLHRLKVPENVFTTYYKYPVYLSGDVQRNQLKSALKERHGVTLTGEVYANLCHSEPMWQHYSYCGRRRATAVDFCPLSPKCGCGQLQTGFPGAEYISRQHICLPLYPGLKPAELEYVVGSLRTEITRIRS
jgi:perosamine synthetase